MLYVLEGCDGAGKTYVANQLKNLLPNNPVIIHCTTKTPNDYNFFRGIIQASIGRDIIADRFCYGQFVYQSEEERKLTEQELKQLETLMLTVGSKIIHVAAPVDLIKDRLKHRNEATDIPVEELCDRYIDLFENKSLTKPYLWWTGGDNL